MKKILFLALSSLIFASCSKSDDPFEGKKPKYNYSNGILFVNEGSFQGNDASIGFSSFDYNNIKTDIYNDDERKLGDVAQSIGFDTDKAFIVVNNSNKIEIVNRYSFINIATITENLNSPRYTAFADGKLYVTNMGSQSVSVYSLTDYSFIKDIPLGSPVENIVAQNNKLYVQKAAFGIGNSIAIIDSKTDEVIKSIELNDNVQGLIAHTGFVYAISSIENRSNFYKINATEDNIITTITTTKVPNAKNLRIDNNILYYTSNNNIHSWTTTATEVNDVPVVKVKGTGGFEFMYAFAVINNQFLVSNAKDFVKPSTVDVYNMEGKKINSFDTGKSTNHFYKN
ncbi:YncE family protein [Myroides guanonis]|uniref:40-residue YVTN family beta-propeller repeat-containing protein n=1 Tax=Myroides guanonis TaxID=1150112 RepID=A0A1I3QRE0_9FLAO|nr:hypothetical protein [Myroides guanonis]SFJ36445.1 hypothetical protein SAMN04487893_10691 [Myroides guanonis]